MAEYIEDKNGIGWSHYKDQTYHTRYSFEHPYDTLEVFHNAVFVEHQASTIYEMEDDYGLLRVTFSRELKDIELELDVNLLTK